MQRPKQYIRMWLKLFAIILLAIFAANSYRGGRISAQGLPLLVGRIEGDDVEVVTTTTAGIETNAAPTVVASGSEVTLRSGQALLLLNSGGSISVCGPAHFKMIQSAGAVTLALDYGRVHPALNSTDDFTIFTPTIIATPIAISGARRDLTIGLQDTGEMCAVATRGAMRVQPQFSDQGLILPQGGAATLSGGQIDSLVGNDSSCSCEYRRAGMQPSHPSAPPREISLLRPVQPTAKKNPSVPPVTQTMSQPVTQPDATPEYTVVMPALTYDANSPAMPPDPDPTTILLVRELRVQAPGFFRGHVDPAPSAVEVSSAMAPTAPALTTPQNTQSQPGLWDRFRNFLRRL